MPLLLQGAAPLPTSMVGIWYGKGQPDDPRVEYIDFFGADGSFLSEFRRYEECTIVWSQVESGTWSFADGVQKIFKTEVNGIPTEAQQEYRVELVTRNQIRVRHLPTNYLFVENRLDRFEFPACRAGV